MINSRADGSHSLVATTRLKDAVEAANTLLYHAVSSGQDLAPAIRDPVIKARAAVEHNEALGEEEEGRFLQAYAKLSSTVAPVTAATLDATSRRHGAPSRLGRLLGWAPISDAQRLVRDFGLLAVCLIVALASVESLHTFIGSISAAEKQFSKNSLEIRGDIARVNAIEGQIEKLTPNAGAASDTANAGAVRQALEERRVEVNVRLDGLQQANLDLSDSINKGYETLGRMLFLGQETVRHLSVPLAATVGGFFLPVLYGALGTCAFILRSLFREMVERTFDPRQTSEFTVRIFLGMLSGLTLQWLIVRPDGSVSGGVTPAVLAFVGGYSVEILFMAMDRLVNLVAGRARTPSRGPVAPRGKRERAVAGAAAPRRSRTREVPTPTNGAASGHRGAALTPVHTEA
jgi:hypothetical protein